MTKTELMQEYNELCDAKRMKIDGIYGNSTKNDILNAINCLKCSNEQLDEYMTVIKLKYPNTHRTISNNGNYKTHPYNRLYVYNTARFVLA